MIDQIFNNLSAESLPVLMVLFVLAFALTGVFYALIGRRKNKIENLSLKNNGNDRTLNILIAERQSLVSQKNDRTLDERGYKTAILDLDRRLLSLKSRSVAQTKSKTIITNFRLVCFCIGISLISMLLYLSIGSPKTKGQPFSDRTQEVLIAKKSMQKVRNEQAKELKKAIKRSEDDPSNIDVWLMLAQAAAATKDIEIEVRALEEAIKISDQKPSILSMMAEAQTRAADGQVTIPARKLIERVLSTNPDEPRALFLSGLANFQDEDYRRAIEKWQLLLSISSPNAPWLNLTRNNIKLAAEAGSIELNERSIGVLESENNLSVIDVSTKEQAMMIEAMVLGLEKRLADQPDDLGGWLRLARAHDVLNNPEKAFYAHAKAAQIGHDNLELQLSFLERLMGTGRTQEKITLAKIIVRNAEQIAPFHPQTLFFKGHIARITGDKKGAVESWELLLSKVPPDSNIATALSKEISKLK